MTKRMSTQMAKPDAIVPREPRRLAANKIDELASRINEISREATLDWARSVGELVIHELFAGSVDAWRQEGRRQSYRKLAARSDLSVSPSSLWRAVGVYVLCERHD